MNSQQIPSPRDLAMSSEDKLNKLKDITTKTIDQIIFKIAEMKREKQFLQSFKDVMKISECLVDIERMLEPIDQSSSSSSSQPSDSASELIKIIHSKSNLSKRGSKINERSVGSIDSLHGILQQCLDNIKLKILAIKKQLIFETNPNVAVGYGEVIRNIRNQLNSIRTLSLPENVVLSDGEKILLKVDCRYHLYDNISATSVVAQSPDRDVKGGDTTSNMSTAEEEYVAGTLFVTNFQLMFVGIHAGAYYRRSCSLHATTKMHKSGKKKSPGDFSYRLNFLVKDGRTLSLSFDRHNNGLKDVRSCVDNLLSNALFCFTHKNDYSAPEHQSLGWNIYDPRDEYARMGIPSPDWKFSHVNGTYFLCDSYPALIVVPECVSDESLKSVAQFRSKGRIPALSYRHWNNKTSITRCSQPRVGIGRNRSEDDELLLNAIRMTSTSAPVATGADRVKQTGEKTLYIIDARPYANAVGNRAKGAGWEIMNNYPNCEIEFMNIANIHVMRNSLLKLRDAVGTSANREDTWFATLESSGWFTHVKLCLAGALRVAKLIHVNHSNVLVHCSDGWDRTAQLVSLASIMLDPYYRTIRGFQVLVEKEWLSFGHKFGQRCGQVYGKDEDERSPIFIQFLECVYQMIGQFPSKFEFNSHFLRTIYTHTYSGKYGNFLYNTEKERIMTHSYGKTISLWLEIDLTIAQHINPLYQPTEEKEVIFPDCSIKKMRVWRQIYFPVSETDAYDPEERIIRQAFERQLEERGQLLRQTFPLVPYRTHTASVSLRSRPMNLSSNQLVPSFHITSSSIKLSDSREEQNLTSSTSSASSSANYNNTTSAKPPVSPSTSTTTTKDKSMSDDKKKLNGFNSLSRGFFRLKKDPKK
eukprot:gene5963-6907_t